MCISSGVEMSTSNCMRKTHQKNLNRKSQKENFKKPVDDDLSDVILRIGQHDLEEELNSLDGYQEFVRETQKENL